MTNKKEEFNKDIEAWKKIKLKLCKWKVFKSNKNSVKSLSSRLNQVEDRISGLEDKVDIVEKSNDYIQKGMI
jgi:hypothetical protein